MAWYGNSYYTAYYNPYAEQPSTSTAPAPIAEHQPLRPHSTHTPPSSTPPTATMRSEDETLFYIRNRQAYTSASPAATSEPAPRGNLISFLAAAQTRDVDFLPTLWDPEQDQVLMGGTAHVRQSFQNLRLSYMFKRIRRDRLDEGFAFQALTSEVFILGHPKIRGHSRVVRLVGICWDVGTANQPTLPVLVFEKAQHGDLRQFMKTAGRELTFGARLQLCAHVAAAIVLMHSHGIIHGDIKPENVLIFDDTGLNNYSAKIIDFGYSVFSDGRDPDERWIHLPTSKPWNAPEVTGWEVLFSSNEAKRADTYSFGLLCLWLLFPEIFEGISGGSEAGGVSPWQDADLRQTVTDLTEGSTGLDGLTKTSIQTFFASTLAHDPNERSLDLEAIMRPFATVEVSAAPSYSRFEMWLPYMQWVPHHKAFDPTPLREKYYKIWEKRAQGQDDSGLGSVEPFQLSKSFRQFMEGDYRIWEHIFKTLQAQASDLPTDPEKVAAAFELAVCCQLGFGTERNATEAALWRQRSNRSEEELMREMSFIKADKGPLVYKNFEPPADMQLIATDFGSEYLRTATLADLEKIYAIASSNADSTLGEDHPVSISLNERLGYTCRQAGNEEKAQAIFEGLVGRCQGFLGPGHALTMRIVSAVAFGLILQGELESAKELEDDLLRRRGQRYGEKNGPLELATMKRLVSIYKQQRQWDEAERLGLKIHQGYEITMGADHPHTLDALDDLIQTYHSRGQPAKSEELGRPLLYKPETVAGPAAFSISNIIQTLITIFRSQERWQDMADAAKRLAHIQTKECGRECRSTLDIMELQAFAYSKQLRLDEAVGIHTEIIETRKRVYGLADEDTIDSMEHLVQTLEHNGNYQDATKLMEEVVGLREQLHGKDDVRTLSSKVMLIQVRAKASPNVH
ncbi:hypothetical protein B0T24DRAFT_145647 [Lasiosphaeria ovina]|uniref:Protein kinase domain-containing protein n=1 Tax=Lasiosphaeria ovina TaxID=92902 RepID=A0AAE0KLY9_9PEZI|nr:hypothetical protein B0T24DRAFT_145647 [Lasiosphaeria ovina]